MLPPNPVTVNWHVTAKCNYRCRFCFFQQDPFLPSLPQGTGATLSKEDSLKVVRLLAEAGVRRVNFAGGEPTLYPLLPQLLEETKSLGMQATVVTNGAGITERWLSRCASFLSGAKLSVESASSEVEAKLGRGTGQHVELVVEKANLLRTHGVPIMVNSVVTSLNHGEDLHPLIRELSPVRWKVFQFLPIAGQNDSEVRGLTLTAEQFLSFVDRHADLHPVAEDNRLMTGSYVMLDPVGRFFQNTRGRYVYSKSILGVGVVRALAEVGWTLETFIERGGMYSVGKLRVMSVRLTGGTR